jgi:hypothetical protein
MGLPAGAKLPPFELNQEARAAGIADAKAGNRAQAERWPPGAPGHGDYELGQQEVEVKRERRRQAALRARQGRPQHRRPSQAQLRAGRALGHPKP